MERSTDTSLDQALSLLRQAFTEAQRSGLELFFGLDLQRVHQRAQLPHQTILARNYQAQTAVELTTVPEVEAFSVALQLVGELQSLRREALLLREEERLRSLPKTTSVQVKVQRAAA